MFIAVYLISRTWLLNEYTYFVETILLLVTESEWMVWKSSVNDRAWLWLIAHLEFQAQH